MKPSTITNRQSFPHGFANIPMYLSMISDDFRAANTINFLKVKK